MPVVGVAFSLGGEGRGTVEEEAASQHVGVGLVIESGVGLAALHTQYTDCQS